MGFTQYFNIGRRLVVSYTHIAALCLVGASKFRQIVYMCYQTQVKYL